MDVMGGEPTGTMCLVTEAEGDMRPSLQRYLLVQHARPTLVGGALTMHYLLVQMP